MGTHLGLRSGCLVGKILDIISFVMGQSRLQYRVKSSRTKFTLHSHCYNVTLRSSCNIYNYRVLWLTTTPLFEHNYSTPVEATPNISDTSCSMCSFDVVDVSEDVQYFEHKLWYTVPGLRQAQFNITVCVKVWLLILADL